MLCACGCGNEAKPGNTYIFNHHKHRRADSKIYRKGNLTHTWKGGKVITTGGYVYVMKPEHPNASKSGYVMEHRLIMEEHLGRLLKKDEDIHHINKIKTDNRLENLQLLTKSEHGIVEHPHIDMTHRRCALCLSNKTGMQKRDGRPHWFYIGHLLVCNKCYMQDYAKKRHGS